MDLYENNKSAESSLCRSENCNITRENLKFTDYGEILKALYECESKMSMVVEESPYPLVIHAEDGEILKISKSWSEISGYTHNEIPNLNSWSEKVYGVSIENACKRFTSLYGIQERIHEGEFTLTIKNGEKRIWDFSSSPLGQLPDGRRTVMSMAVDVTERKAMLKELNLHRNHLEELVKERTTDLERSRKAALSIMQDATIQRQKTEELMVKLRESNRQIETLKQQIEYILGATKTGLDIIDEDFNLLYIDPEWQKIYGDNKGKKCYEYFCDHKAPCENCGIPAAIDSKVVTIWEYKLVKEKDRPVQVTSIPYQDSKGKWVVAEVKVDISERKRMEKELLKAKEASDLANKAKSAFLANMSHEIRTPMHAILGYTQLLMRNHNLEPVQREYLDIINRSGNHLLALLNDVLEMSKIEAGKITINKTSFSLRELINDIELMFSAQAQMKGLYFYIIEDGYLFPDIYTDREKVRQILSNLLTNAVKFTEKGGIKVTVGSELIAHQYGGDPVFRFKFEVEDTGCGIAEDEINKVFAPFEQTRSGINSNTGTGLGMPISRQYARLLGGDLKFSSAVDSGTVFSFDFEAKAVESNTARYVESAFSDVSCLAPGEQEWRILVVDDNETNRFMLVQLLNHAGFSVAEACDGNHAIEQFDMFKPHVILLDIKMPGINGFETAKLIRQSEEGKVVKILAVSASVLNETLETDSKADMDGYILKPFREEEIFRKIHNLTGVKYVFKKSIIEDAESVAVSYDIMKNAVKSVPDEVKNRFLEALEIGDMTSMQELITEIAKINEDLSDTMIALASRFDYAGLSKLFERETV